MSTKIINFFGGPGAGKSTLAAGTFYELKKRHMKCELVTEYAKDVTWENRISVLNCQPYIFGKQLHRLERLINKVDIILNDSPIALSVFYRAEKYPKSFCTSVIDIFKTMNNINFYVYRMSDHYFNDGRKESQDLAYKIDNDILSFLGTHDIQYHTIPKNYDSVEKILDFIL